MSVKFSDSVKYIGVDDTDDRSIRESVCSTERSFL